MIEVEVYDPDAREWEQIVEQDVCVEWESDRATLYVCGVPTLARFRVWEIVSAGTDRLLVLDAIPGLTLYSRL